jgi:signal transduction histidine kinase
MSSASRRATRQPRTPANSRDDFLDLAGHELRTPITALRGQAQLLQRRLHSQPDRAADADALDRMIYQIERLNLELDIYLDASHIFRKRFDLLPVECDLVTIARRLVEMYTAGVGTHEFALDTDEDEIRGVWDRKRIHMALASLLANAVKFSAGGKVSVRTMVAGDNARIEVHDAGVGVRPADRYRIFEPYEHGSNVAHGGAGLGLFVTRAIVRRHQGRLGVRARPGGGSVFWLTMPITSAGREA